VITAITTNSSINVKPPQGRGRQFLTEQLVELSCRPVPEPVVVLGRPLPSLQAPVVGLYGRLLITVLEMIFAYQKLAERWPLCHEPSQQLLFLLVKGSGVQKKNGAGPFHRLLRKMGNRTLGPGKLLIMPQLKEENKQYLIGIYQIYPGFPFEHLLL
jgi:hypothetical protein